MLEQPLSDVRVLDLTWHIAGPYCTKLLADYGADVIKIEKPGEGDPTRRMEPFLGDDPHPEKSGLFLYLNNNKRGVTLNLKSEKGKHILKDLVKDADILVESFRPGVMAELKLDYETLEKINPKLVMTSISNFGQTGPYRDFKSSELIIAAMGFCLLITGSHDHYPLKYAANVMQFDGGVAAATASLMALRGGARGEGEHVDVSLQEVQLGSIDKVSNALLGYQYHGPGTRQARTTTKGMFCSGVFPCKDGWFNLYGYADYFPRVCKMLDRPDLLKDPRFTDPLQAFIPENAEAMNAILIEWFMERTKMEIWEQGRKADIMGAPLSTMEDVVNDPHFKERGFWTKLEHPIRGEVEFPGAPFIMSEGSSQIRRPAPVLGEHNEEVYCKMLGYATDDLVKLTGIGVI